jgi:aldehyde:ferredoxin oxidoreductase
MSNDMYQIESQNELSDRATERYEKPASQRRIRAIAARSKKRYPGKMAGDKEVFKTFARDEIRRLVKQPGESLNHKSGTPVSTRRLNQKSDSPIWRVEQRRPA